MRLPTYPVGSTSTPLQAVCNSEEPQSMASINENPWLVVTRFAKAIPALTIAQVAKEVTGAS